MSRGKFYRVKIGRWMYASWEGWAESVRDARNRALDDESSLDWSTDDPSVEDVERLGLRDAYDNCDNDCDGCGYAGECDNYKSPDDEDEDESEDEEDKNAPRCTECGDKFEDREWYRESVTDPGFCEDCADRREKDRREEDRRRAEARAADPY